MDEQLRALERQAIAGDPDATSRWFEGARRTGSEPRVLKVEAEVYDASMIAMTAVEDLIAQRRFSYSRIETVPATAPFTEEDCASTVARCVARSRQALLCWDLVGFVLRPMALPGVIAAVARRHRRVAVAIRGLNLAGLMPGTISVDVIRPLLRATFETMTRSFALPAARPQVDGDLAAAFGQPYLETLYDPARLREQSIAAWIDSAEPVSGMTDGTKPFLVVREEVADRWAAIRGAA